MSFEELAAAAQVGARRATPPRGTDFSLDGEERILLLELGTLGLMRRAGALPLAGEALAAAPEERQRIAERASDPLAEALDGSLFAALEWARAAEPRGMVAPISTVAALVPLAARHPELRAVLGARGRWLAGVMGVELESKPDLPDPAEWGTLDAKARLRLVEEGPEDAETFARALGERRKDLREAAVERLVRMPGSPQAQALARLALEAVAVRKTFLRSPVLGIEPPDPESLPDWLPRSTANRNMGPKSLALFDLVSHVPPSLWGEPPDRLLDLAKGVDDFATVGLAWQAAAERFGDQAWFDASLPRMKLDRLPPRSSVIVRASDAVFERTALHWIGSGERALADVAQAAAMRERPLSPALSRAFVEATIRLGQKALDPENLYRLPPLGRVLDPSVLPTVEAGLGEGQAGLAEGWRKILDLRRRLLESLR